MAQFIFGAGIAAANKTISRPLENYQRLIQNKNTLEESSDFDKKLSKIDSFPSFVSYMSNTKGYSSLFTGNTYAILSYIPTQMINSIATHAVFTVANAITSNTNTNTNTNTTSSAHATTTHSIINSIFSGGIAGVISLSFVYPIEWKLQEYQMKKLFGVKLKERKDILKYYQGFLTSIIGIFVYRGLYFGLYDFIGKLDIKMPQFRLNENKMFVGLLITVIAGLVSYPLDTIRQRQILTDEDFQTAKNNLIEKYGVSSLWNGAAMSIIRGMIGMGTMMVAASVIRSLTLGGGGRKRQSSQLQSQQQ